MVTLNEGYDIDYNMIKVDAPVKWLTSAIVPAARVEPIGVR